MSLNTVWINHAKNEEPNQKNNINSPIDKQESITSTMNINLSA